MTALTWHATGSRLYEAGVDRGVLYPASGAGVAWNGLLSVKDNTEDAGQSVIFQDGQRVRAVVDIGDFNATLEAVTYPYEFLPYDGVANDFLHSQNRLVFGFSYRTMIGNDVDGNSHGYKIHLVYNAVADPTDYEYTSLQLNPELVTFSWDITTKPVAVPGFAPLSHVIIDSTKIYPSALAAIEATLYGSSGVAPSLPSLTALLALFNTLTMVVITDNGNGTWSASGPPELVYLTDPHTFAVNSPTATYLDANTYTIY